MHLRDGGAAQRLAVDVLKHLLRRAAKLLGEQGENCLEGQGIRTALQMLEFLNPFGAKNINPGGQNLAELDKGWPQLLKRQPETMRRARITSIFLRGRAAEPRSPVQLNPAEKTA